MDFAVGERYRATDTGYWSSLASSSAQGRDIRITPEIELEVVKVNKTNVHFRALTPVKDTYSSRTYVDAVLVFRVYSNAERYLEKTADPDPNAPKPRALGEVPEGMISPDDPGLAWLWEDAGKLANMSNHCGEYDKICDRLGIPGRERNFTVKREVNGLSISSSIKARSKKQAEEIMDSKLTSINTSTTV